MLQNSVCHTSLWLYGSHWSCIVSSSVRLCKYLYCYSTSIWEYRIRVCLCICLSVRPSALSVANYSQKHSQWTSVNSWHTTLTTLHSLPQMWHRKMFRSLTTNTFIDSFVIFLYRKYTFSSFVYDIDLDGFSYTVNAPNIAATYIACLCHVMLFCFVMSCHSVTRTHSVT